MFMRGTWHSSSLHSLLGSEHRIWVVWRRWIFYKISLAKVCLFINELENLSEALLHGLFPFFRQRILQSVQLRTLSCIVRYAKRCRSIWCQVFFFVRLSDMPLCRVPLSWPRIRCSGTACHIFKVIGSIHKRNDLRFTDLDLVLQFYWAFWAHLRMKSRNILAGLQHGWLIIIPRWITFSQLLPLRRGSMIAFSPWQAAP